MDEWGWGAYLRQREALQARMHGFRRVAYRQDGGAGRPQYDACAFASAAVATGL
jgi:hypothetical protein